MATIPENRCRIWFNVALENRLTNQINFRIGKIVHYAMNKSRTPHWMHIASWKFMTSSRASANETKLNLTKLSKVS